MPKIPKQVLDCVVYMYEDEGAAKHGLEFGGTGFLVQVPSKVAPSKWGYNYVVTNWHVAVRGNVNVVRVNGRRVGDNPPEPLIRKIPDWYHNDKYDIAVAPLPMDPSSQQFAVAGLEGFVTDEQIKQFELGPGEDVFMVGRFVDHDGGGTNVPAVRFGNISVMPTPQMQPTGVEADTYCIDLHSRGGYSGSPVFIYRMPGYDLSERIESEQGKQRLLLSGVNFFGLLGIHYDQFPEEWPIDGSYSAEAKVKKDGPVIRGLSGMTKVLPASAILEVLNMPALVQRRADEDESYVRPRFAMAGDGEANLSSQKEALAAPATDNPSHKEDFTSLLNAAAKANKPAS